MFLRNPGCLHALAISLLLAMGMPALAETYRAPALHYTLQLPDDWQAMSAEEVGTINEKLGQRLSGQTTRYEGGFRRKEISPHGYPYILVQREIGGRSSYEEIEQGLAREMQAPIQEGKGSLGDLVRNLAVNRAVLDRSHNRVLIRFQIDVAAVGKVQGLSVGHLGAEGIVLLHCYAREKDFERFLPAFHQINESFQYDEGYTFVPGRGSFSWKSVGEKALIGGVAGGLLGGLAYLFRKKSRRV